MADANALVLAVSADTSKALKELDKLNKKLDSLNDNAERTSKKTKGSLDSLFGNPSKALDKVFDSTRFKVLDTGIARVGLFGSALENLGVVGLGAAAAIGAVALALGQAKAAMTFADQLNDTATRLHVTTDALQEYRYAARLAGDSEAGADQALEAFSITLGKAQAGLPKAIKGFKELGFTEAQIKGFKDVDTALQAVSNRISQLAKPAQKDAVVDQLGLTGMKQLVEGGADAMAQFRREAQAAGVVMDAGLLKRAAEANDKFETLSKVIDIQLKSAFVDLIPVLTAIMGVLAQMAHLVGGIVDDFRSIQGKTTAGLRDIVRTSQLRNDEMTGRATAEHRPLSGSEKAVIARNNALMQGAAAQLRERDTPPPPVPKGTSLVNVGGGGGQDKTAQQFKHFNDELARIQAQIISASDNERHSAEERAKTARDRLEVEIAARDQSIQDQIATKAITAAQGKVLTARSEELARVQRSEMLAQQQQAQRELALQQEQDLYSAVASLLDAQIALADTAEERGRLEAQALDAQRTIARKLLAEALADDPNKTAGQRAFELSAFDATTKAQKDAQNAKLADEIAAERRSIDQATLDAQIEGLHLADQLAETQAEHRAVQLRILDLQYRREKAELEGVLASQTASDAEKKIAQLKLDELNRQQPGQQQGVIQNTRGPLEQLKSGLPLDPAKLNEALENVSAHGLQSLEDGLVGVITHTKKLGDVFREVAAQIIADLARIAIQQAIIGPLTSALTGGMSSLGKGLGNLFGGGRASGGPVSAGKVYKVGEDGEEFFAPGVSGTIIPHGAIKAVSSMGGAANVTVLQTIVADLSNTITTPELMAQFNAMSQRHAAQAGRAAASFALQNVPGQLERMRKLG